VNPQVLDRSFSTRINTLVSEAFQYPAGRFFFEDFPVWDSDSVVRLGCVREDRLLSHVGIRYSILRGSEGPIPIALIGAVATAENERGKGLSSLLLREALQRIDETACAWTLLWGSEHSFYSRFGFKLEGVQARALISELSIPIAGLQSRRPTEGIHGKIWQHLHSRTAGVAFQAADRDWVFRHRSVRWLSFEEPFAFIAYERGMDLRHIVHETGGDLEGIQQLLYWIYRDCPIAQVMAEPRELLRLGFPQESLTHEHLCLARPRHPGQAWNPEFWVSGLSAC
jgi:predicted N-acetyltransferase YhbS